MNKTAIIIDSLRDMSHKLTCLGVHTDMDDSRAQNAISALEKLLPESVFVTEPTENLTYYAPDSETVAAVLHQLGTLFEDSTRVDEAVALLPRDEVMYLAAVLISAISRMPKPN